MRPGTRLVVASAGAKQASWATQQTGYAKGRHVGNAACRRERGAPIIMAHAHVLPTAHASTETYSRAAHRQHYCTQVLCEEPGLEGHEFTWSS